MDFRRITLQGSSFAKAVAAQYSSQARPVVTGKEGGGETDA
jgi:hypothetical protein